ncbi:MAG: sigma 54-interacting transcriptional regulator, partial [Polyangiaceae bacterium]
MESKKTVESALFSRVVESLGGAAIVLNADLRICLATPAASEILGFDVPLGASAPKVLCGDSTKRPVAEALAAGRPIQATISRPTGPEETRLIRLKSVPVRERDRLLGWILLLDTSEESAKGATLFRGMWTQDPRMLELFRILTKVAVEDVTVLVRGETGTGKELVARAIHDLSPRHEGPFRALNCAALPSTLLESELFGHVRGSFTGALKDTPGYMQLAHKGTLFLDEVAEL